MSEARSGTMQHEKRRHEEALALAPGERVQIRDEEWLVRGTNRTFTGALAVKVVGLSELVRGKSAIFLSDLDEIEPLRPEETKLVADASPQFRRARLYLESLLRKTPPTDARIHLGHRAAADPVPYQLAPAHKALARVRPRLLIADGVGLGKTIEVGILLAELVRRGKGQRILVVALKSILEQFQRELWARFAIPLVRLDSEGIRRVQTQIPANMNPLHHFDRVIVSIDTLKRDAQYAAWLEQARWDAVVIDECQNVALRGGSPNQRAKLAERLAHTADALIMTSATPHDGRAQSLASLVNLLEPTAIPNEQSFTADDIRDLFIRRFKRDVEAESGSAFFERRTTLERVPASEQEEAALSALAKASFRTIDVKRQSRGVLFRTTLLKAFLSSPEACLETIAEREKTLARKAGDPSSTLSEPDVEHDRAVLAGLSETVGALDPKGSTKLARLFAALDALGYAKKQAGERVVIFSERIRTLKMLQAQLRKRYGLGEKEVPIFHGGVRDVDQQALVKAFGTKDAPVRIFLASDAASEGINLHFFCRRMIHFDVPWSLITLEQRNGRIDRFGQKAEPDIRYLVLSPKDEALKGDLAVIDRLVEKEKEAHRNLGDAALLMQAYDAEKEEAQVARAIEGKIAPEAAIPDLPDIDPNDPLAALLYGEGAASPAAPSSAPGPETASPLSLFEDDLAYAREALAELARDDADFPRPEFYDEPRGLLLRAPDDLRVRFSHLPPELRPAPDQELKLTVEPAQVQKSLTEARERQDRFPEWSYFWPLHPVAEWLDDRLLAHFGRHEAPVIEVKRLPEQAAVALLFQGVISNRRSQPVGVHWFAIGYDLDAEEVGITELEALVPVAGLDGPLSNPGGDRDVRAFEALLPGAVERAYKYLAQLRKHREDELAKPLDTELRRLGKWFAGKSPFKGQLDTAYGEVKPDRELTAKEQRAYEQAKKAKAAYERYVRDVLGTVERPSLRLAAVLAVRQVP